MVIKCEPVFEAVEDIVSRASGPKPRVLMMTPQGKRFDQRMAEEFSRENHLVFICGRYEGFDERIREHLVTDEVSIGDYVITGGELAALIITDAVCRLLPGVLGDDESSQAESFSSGMLEYPQYTRPAEFRGWNVPDVLLSGNHAEIDKWRRQTALRRTMDRRPDLLSDEDKQSAEKIIKSSSDNR
jgi:tRNA (guanine37-N1)-methyltransferase